MIEFLDVGATYRALREELDEAYHRVMEEGWYIRGRQFAAFEGEFAAACAVDHAVGVGNGLDALSLILRALEISEADEVIVPAHTFIATWLSVTAVGARPIPVDADERTMNMAVERIAEAIGPRTRAIVAVHLYGLPVDVPAIRAIADPLGIPVIEDAAQAHGARWLGRDIGSLARAAAFSFYPTKNLGAFGDAGAIVTDDAQLAGAARRLANYGSEIKYQHDVQGGNSRLDELQAAFLRVKLRHLSAWNARRSSIAGRYSAELREVSGLYLPFVPEEAEPVWHLYVVRHPSRDALRRQLRAKEIDAQVHYPVAISRTGAFADLGYGPLEVTERICATCLSLPMGPHMSDDDVSRAIDAVRSAVREVGDG